MVNEQTTLAEKHGTTGIQAEAVDDAYDDMEAREGRGRDVPVGVWETDARSTVYVVTRIVAAAFVTAGVGALAGLIIAVIVGFSLPLGTAMGAAAGTVVGILVSARLSLDRVEKASYESSNLPRA